MLVALVACAPDPVPVSADPCAPGRACVVAGLPGISGFNGDGEPAGETWLFQPQDVTPIGDAFYIGDTNNHVVRRVGADGIATIVAGTGFPDFGGDGGPATLENLHGPVMVVPDPDEPDVLWLAVPDHHRVARIRNGQLDYPYGTGVASFSGDRGPADLAELDRPSSIAFDDAGAMYVSDRMNQVVRRIDDEGVITTVAGVPGVQGYDGDGGPATEALLSAPDSTEQDPANRIAVAGDRLVIADTGNDVLREVDLATGIITTLATGLSAPHDVAIDIDGSVVVADTGHACVRRVAADGSLTTVLGVCGEPGPIEHGAPVADAHLGRPSGVAIDDHGAVWVTDADHDVVILLR